jgi:guanylate kinase
VLRSSAQYPILLRSPWNQSATGVLAVNTYDEFLKIVEVIAKSYSKDGKPDLSKPNIFVLVGASGCGKSKIAKRLLKEFDCFENPVSYTTEDPTALEENDWYNYVPIETFREMCETGELFQSTMYAGHGYGSCKSDIDAILSKGKHVMTTMDICGAMSLKTNFKNVTTIYIHRDKKKLIDSILRKNSSNEDKVNRIIAIESEDQTAKICDYIVDFDDYDDAVAQICKILKIES